MSEKIKIKSFRPNDIETNAQIFADLLPKGEVFLAKNIYDSNLRKLLRGLSGEMYRVQDKTYEIAFEYVIENTTKLIEEWEKSVGIPDECFSTNVDIELRRKQVIAKLGKMNIQVAEDYIKLAAFFGYNIKINTNLYEDQSRFPLKFPIKLNSLKNFKFTIEIEFLNVPPVNNFPLYFPIKFTTSYNFMVCLFERIKEANIKIIYINSGSTS